MPLSPRSSFADSFGLHEVSAPAGASASAVQLLRTEGMFVQSFNPSLSNAGSGLGRGGAASGRWMAPRPSKKS